MITIFSILRQANDPPDGEGDVVAREMKRVQRQANTIWNNVYDVFNHFITPKQSTGFCPLSPEPKAADAEDSKDASITQRAFFCVYNIHTASAEIIEAAQRDRRIILVESEAKFDPAPIKDMAKVHNLTAARKDDNEV